jgi:hypothetical protein
MPRRNGARNGGRNGGGRNGARNGGRGGRHGARAAVRPEADFGVFVVPCTAQRAKDRLDGLFLLDVNNLPFEQVEEAWINFSGIEIGLIVEMINVRDIFALYPEGSFGSGLEFALKVSILKQELITKMGPTQE